VLFSVLDPLLAVVALSTGHTSELYWRLSRNWHASLLTSMIRRRPELRNGKRADSYSEGISCLRAVFS
jgi:hypothetical protein